MVGKKARLVLDSLHLKSLIQDSEYDVESLSKSIDISSNTIKRWMNGAIKSIKKSNLKSLAQALKVSEDELLASSPETVSQVDTKEYDQLFIDLFDLNKWPSISLLVNSLITPDKSDHIRVRLYEYLFMTSLLSGKINEAKMYSQKISSIALKSSSSQLQEVAKQAEFLTFVMDSKFENALLIAENINLQEIDSIEKAISILFLSQIERAVGSDDKAIELINISSNYSKNNTASPLHKAHKSAIYLLRADINLSNGNIKDALSDIDKLSSLADEKMNNRLKATVAILQNFVQAKLGNKLKKDIIQHSLEYFDQKELFWSLNYLKAAEIYSMAGDT